jgi:hypothetical protein
LSSLPSLELPKLALSLQFFQLSLRHGSRAPSILHFMLYHGLHLSFTSPLPSFLHQPTSTSTTTTITTTSHQPHSTHGTSLVFIGEIHGIGIGNRAGNPSAIRHFDNRGLATLKDWQSFNTSALGHFGTGVLLGRHMWASGASR